VRITILFQGTGWAPFTEVICETKQTMLLSDSGAILYQEERDLPHPVEFYHRGIIKQWDESEERYRS